MLLLNRLHKTQGSCTVELALKKTQKLVERSNERQGLSSGQRDGWACWLVFFVSFFARRGCVPHRSINTRAKVLNVSEKSRLGHLHV